MTRSYKLFENEKYSHIEQKGVELKCFRYLIYLDEKFIMDLLANLLKLVNNCYTFMVGSCYILCELCLINVYWNLNTFDLFGKHNVGKQGQWKK